MPSEIELNNFMNNLVVDRISSECLELRMLHYDKNFDEYLKTAHRQSFIQDRVSVYHNDQMRIHRPNGDY